jgi:hypothetical protein
MQNFKALSNSTKEVKELINMLKDIQQSGSLTTDQILALGKIKAAVVDRFIENNSGINSINKCK